MPPPTNGRRIRLNVSAVHEGEFVLKVLVIALQGWTLKELLPKVDSTLKDAGVCLNVWRLLNSRKSLLPNDERLGDMLQDGESLFAVMVGEGEWVSTPRRRSSSPCPSARSPSQTLWTPRRLMVLDTSTAAAAFSAREQISSCSVTPRTPRSAVASPRLERTEFTDTGPRFTPRVIQWQEAMVYPPQRFDRYLR
eukprot:TRINITY_DN123366_c0_g1_i1.p1 TRINITY_DN123366_c0_g1~~TRINITY_DN123366_c0_g1_i1.p1  ORF type:complete len:194 (-),score=21.71 TRINITY_DN123366_c0_g1_i1:213-794(-)